MKIHDIWAEKAFAMGKTEDEFHSAAQRHANVTWILLIVAAAVWYFVDWRWALIPAAIGAFSAFQSVSATMVASKLEKMRPSSTPSSSNDATSIIHAYGKALETDAPMPGTVADASKLPYPKPQIKAALIAALQIEPDQQMREHLKAAYVSLADWQDGVGENNRGLDASSLDLGQDTKALAKQVIDATESGKDWVDLAQKEQETLKMELKDLGI